MTIKTQSTKSYLRPLRKYRQAKTPLEYITQRVCIPQDASTECWIWLGPKDRGGYGQVQHSRVAKDLKVTRAHQMSWVMVNGLIPSGMFICHSCDNPSCVNPKHLFVGTAHDNVQDMVSKGRAFNGSKRNPRYKEILEEHGKKSCKEVSKIYGVSYSRVCQIWRENGKTGRNY